MRRERGGFEVPFPHELAVLMKLISVMELMFWARSRFASLGGVHYTQAVV